jgi:dihydrodipicolinate synthase/N-acetylneuraminate lyase
LDAGVNGIILGGTLGEASVLSTEEKERIVKFTIEKVAGKVPVVLNIAEGSTKEALQQAAYAKAWGAQGIMILPPMRYKSDHRETVTYFATVAKSTDLPIMIYNNPVDYKIDVTPDMFEDLTSCKNIQAIKESTRDVTNITRLINRFGDRYKILCGVDTLAMENVAGCAWMGGRIGLCFPERNRSDLSFGKSGSYSRSHSHLPLVHAIA